MFWGTPTFPPPAWYPTSRMLLLFLLHFEAVVAESQWFGCSNYAWEWGITACVLHCLPRRNGTQFVIYCERSFPKLTPWWGLSSGDKACLPPTPTESLWIPASVVTIEQPTKARTAFLRGLVWPNIGPAAARPAGPAPTALVCVR